MYTSVQCSQRSKEGAGSFGAGVTGGCESPNVGAENLNCWSHLSSP